SEAIRERLEAFCVAVVYAKGATNLTVRALSAARSFRRSELSGLLKEDCDVGEIMRALRRTGLYAQKLRTERAWRLTAVPLVTQWSDRQGFLLALSAAAYHPIVHDTLRLVARLLGSMQPNKSKASDKAEETPAKEMLEDNSQIRERLSEHYDFSLLVG